MIEHDIENFLNFAIERGIMDARDKTYARNNLFDMLNISPTANAVPPLSLRGNFGSLPSNPPLAKGEGHDSGGGYVEKLTNYAIANGLIKEYERVNFETRLFSAVTALPSVVIDKFEKIAKDAGIVAATDWWFEFSKNTNYLRMSDINKNMLWKHTGKFGELEVTVNLSKPEKTPEQIKAEAEVKKSGYPACMLCRENEGFPGHVSHPARQTLRIIPITLTNEPWGLQYSPYQYYREHCIALSMVHRPMKVDGACLARLLEFTTLFPHYFLGSNAALPIVGGSILSHDHYQGGAKVLPIFKSGIRKTFDVKAFENVKISVADWYNSVVRIESENIADTQKAGEYVLKAWQNYSDESVNIIAFSGDVPHNAVTPIARNEGGVFTLDLILRNNRTDAAHPYGIFHPAEHLHHIKKEGIGIIEVSGTFILPGRLKAELEAGSLTKEVINSACEEILEATAVFKNTAEGQAAFEKFMLTL